jgi:hypothetical protein
MYGNLAMEAESTCCDTHLIVVRIYKGVILSGDHGSFEDEYFTKFCQNYQFLIDQIPTFAKNCVTKEEYCEHQQLLQQICGLTIREDCTNSSESLSFRNLFSLKSSSVSTTSMSEEEDHDVRKNNGGSLASPR